MVLGLSKCFYYSKPDGQDLLGKIGACIKLTSLVAIPLGVYDGATRTISKSALHKIIVGLRPISYIYGISFVFANVTYMSTRMREKDDALNHGIGVLATTPLVKAWLKFPAVEIAQIMLHSSIFMMINKARISQESELEQPFTNLNKGLRNRLPNWDYWEYWTNEETPLEDYVN